MYMETARIKLLSIGHNIVFCVTYTTYHLLSMLNDEKI